MESAIYYHFSVTCPFCKTFHEKISIVILDQSNKGHARHFSCCGYEIGFSVRRKAVTLEQAAAELMRAATMVAAVWEGNNDFDSKDSERALYQAMRRMQEAQS